MTQAQEKQFNESGCISRCLLVLASLKNIHLTRDDYCQQFGHLFLNPAQQYGALFPSQMVEVTRPLGLGTQFESFRRYGEIDDEFNKAGRSIFVVSEIDLNPGNTGINRHCSVLAKIDGKEFTIITPSKDGKEYVIPFPASDWEAKLCHGIVFR